MERSSRVGPDQYIRSWIPIVSDGVHSSWFPVLTASSDRAKDVLLNPDLLVPPRPTISNIQWISGTQYVTPADMDLLSKISSTTILDQYPANIFHSWWPRPSTLKPTTCPTTCRSRAGTSSRQRLIFYVTCCAIPTLSWTGRRSS